MFEVKNIRQEVFDYKKQSTCNQTNHSSKVFLSGLDLISLSQLWMEIAEVQKIIFQAPIYSTISKLKSVKKSRNDYQINSLLKSIKIYIL